MGLKGGWRHPEDPWYRIVSLTPCHGNLPMPCPRRKVPVVIIAEGEPRASCGIACGSKKLITCLLGQAPLPPMRRYSLTPVFICKARELASAILILSSQQSTVDARADQDKRVGLSQ